MSDESPPGAPAWIVTYGDMMSLLLTFFIMLVSLSEVAGEQRYRAVLESLESYLGYHTGPPAPSGRHYPLNSLLAALESLGSFTNLDRGHGGVRQEGAAGRALRVVRTRDGEPVRVGRPIAFSPGEIRLNETADEELRAVADDLAGKPHKIEIRAHAAAGDGQGEAIPDLSVLTYLRAREVQRSLIRFGVAADRMRMTAAADTEPPEPSGDEQAVPADRVEILILDEYARTFVGPAAAAR